MPDLLFLPLDTSAAQYTVFGLVIMLLMGGGLGLLLYVASRFFKVDLDPRIEKILAVLPNVNCGACGFGGCAAYAEAVVLEGAECGLCAPGGADVVAAVAEIMGAEAEEKEPEVAVVHCGGSIKMARNAADYYGIDTCLAADVAGLNSPKACLYGCLGFGDCVIACPFDAMVMGADGLPQVIESSCVGCGKCVEACSRNLIELHSRKSSVHVLCRSRDPGKDVRRACDVGCIACKRCEKACPKDAIHVIDNLAVIDYEKCISCGKCAKECPQGIIVNWRKVRKELAKLQETAESALLPAEKEA